ncbi:MAG: RluA family pseudouridine synthase [Clostridia bacterium]|nr:RluA family pseudouridine synthase [Clostridia bacterium]
MNYTVLYSDRDVAVCVKPTGMLSQSDEKGEPGLRELLEAELGRTVYPIHRLDRPVSGLIVFALNPKASAKLSADISDHRRFTKEYLVCVSGTPSEANATLKDYLFRDRGSGKTYAVSTPRKGAKEAVLEYRLLSTVRDESRGDISLLSVRLHTGRTHQIRAQFASRAHPVAGDGKYGSRIKSEGIALHSCRLAFDHPYSGKRTELLSLPENSEIFRLFGNIRELI